MRNWLANIQHCCINCKYYGNNQNCIHFSPIQFYTKQKFCEDINFNVTFIKYETVLVLASKTMLVVLDCMINENIIDMRHKTKCGRGQGWNSQQKKCIGTAI